jgi:excisionase family DNA binding protein
MYDELPSIMTVNELAIYLRLHEQTVYKMAKEGRLPAYKVGNRWRFKREMIDTWLLAQRSGASPRKVLEVSSVK